MRPIATLCSLSPLVPARVSGVSGLFHFWQVTTILKRSMRAITISSIAEDAKPMNVLH